MSAWSTRWFGAKLECDRIFSLHEANSLAFIAQVFSIMRGIGGLPSTSGRRGCHGVVLARIVPMKKGKSCDCFKSADAKEIIQFIRHKSRCNK